MAYQQTTAASIDDICTQVAAFAVANAGFTNAGTTVIATKTVQRLVKGGIYYYFAPHTSGNFLVYKMGYTLAAAWPTTANGQEFFGFMSCQTFAGPYTNLFMFTDGTAVHVVVELTNGIYNHFSFGSITKLETFTGGEYMTSGNYTYISGSVYQSYFAPGNGNFPPFPGMSTTAPVANHTAYMRNIVTTQWNDMRDFDPIGMQKSYTGGVNKRCMMSGPSASSVYSGTTWSSGTDVLILDEPNTGSNRTPMHPNYVFTYEPVTGLWRLAGHIPNMRFVNMTQLDEKEIIYTDWQVFPMSQRNGNSVNTCNSGQMAMAYKRA